MNVSWKASVFEGAAAFLLSAVVGALGGVAFGALFLRALVSAAVFAGGAIGVRFLVQKYLPELAESPPSSGGVGGRVDLVVDDEVDDLMGHDHDDANDYSVDTDGSEDDVDGELEEEPESDGETVGDPGADAETDDVEELDEVPEPDEANLSAEDGPAGALLEEVEDVDTAGNSLPDLGSYEDSFVSTGDGIADEPGGTSESGDDPAVMARAIRTVLKRDE
jgi:hypothetical protein